MLCSHASAKTNKDKGRRQISFEFSSSSGHCKKLSNLHELVPPTFPMENHTFLMPSTLVQPWPMQTTFKFKFAWFPPSSPRLLPAPRGSPQLREAPCGSAQPMRLLPTAPPRSSSSRLLAAARCSMQLPTAPCGFLRLRNYPRFPATPRRYRSFPLLPGSHWSYFSNGKIHFPEETTLVI